MSNGKIERNNSLTNLIEKKENEKKVRKEIEELSDEIFNLMLENVEIDRLCEDGEHELQFSRRRRSKRFSSLSI